MKSTQQVIPIEVSVGARLEVNDLSFKSVLMATAGHDEHLHKKWTLASDTSAASESTSQHKVRI